MAGIVAMTVVYLHLEVDRTVGFLHMPLRLPMLTILWIGAAMFLFSRIRGWGEQIGVPLFVAAGAPSSSSSACGICRRGGYAKTSSTPEPGPATRRSCGWSISGR